MQSANTSAAAPAKPPQQPSDLAQYIEQTLLKAEATTPDVERLCEEALRFEFRGVCVNSAFVAAVATKLKGSSVLTVSVVGFPLGAMIPEVKARETELAVAAGAQEIDMVIALGRLRAGETKFVEDDIRAVVRAAGPAPVKVILESGLLAPEELTLACRLSESAGAAFVKTATGFLGRGASVDDIRAMRAACSSKMKIKASGGVKTFEQACDLIRAGADRLGTSSGVALVSGERIGEGY